MKDLMEKYGIADQSCLEKLIACAGECGLSGETVLRSIRLPKEFDPKNIEPGTRNHPKLFGLLDTQTSTWMGSSDAPLTYDSFEFALVRARLLGVQLKWSPLRIVVKFFTSATKKRDELKVDYSIEEALERLEEGLTL